MAKNLVSRLVLASGLALASFSGACSPSQSYVNSSRREISRTHSPEEARQFDIILNQLGKMRESEIKQSADYFDNHKEEIYAIFGGEEGLRQTLPLKPTKLSEYDKATAVIIRDYLEAAVNGAVNVYSQNMRPARGN